MAIAPKTFYTIHGNKEIEELPRKRHWDLQNGVESTRNFVGVSPAIQAKFNELSSAAVADTGIDDMDETIDGRAGQLVCRVFDDSGGSAGGNTEELNAIWELYATDILKPLESHTDYNAINGKRMSDIIKFISDAETISPALSNDTERAFAGYIAHQVLDYQIGHYTLRKSTTLSSRSAIKAAHASVYRVVNLSSAINPPSVLLGILTSLQKEDGTTGSWEWLKKVPQIIQITKTKFQLRYEWIGAERWAKFYGGTWAPAYE